MGSWVASSIIAIRMSKLGRNSIPPVFFFFFFSAAIVNCPFASRPRRDSRRWQQPLLTQLGGAFDGRFESQLVALERPLLSSLSLGVLYSSRHSVWPRDRICSSPRSGHQIPFDSLLPFSARRRQRENQPVKRKKKEKRDKMK